MSFNYVLGSTPEEVFKNLKVDKETGKFILEKLFEEGYTARGICFAAAKSEEKLYRFIGDSRFKSVFINEVRKSAFKPDDQRWESRRPNKSIKQTAHKKGG